jgi:hypothetical protein
VKPQTEQKAIGFNVFFMQQFQQTPALAKAT